MKGLSSFAGKTLIHVTRYFSLIWHSFAKRKFLSYTLLTFYERLHAFKSNHFRHAFKSHLAHCLLVGLAAQ